MGVHIEIWRQRIGCFTQPRKTKNTKNKTWKVNRNILRLLILILCLQVTILLCDETTNLIDKNKIQMYKTNNTAKIINDDSHRAPTYQTEKITGIPNLTTSKNTPNINLLIRCGDIETNPGPPGPGPDRITRQTKITATGELDTTRELDTTTIVELIQSMKTDICQDIKSLKSAFMEHKETVNKKLDQANTEIKNLRQENQTLRESIERIEDQSKKKNLLIYGIDEETEQRETNHMIENKVRDNFKDAGIENADSKERLPIDRIFRIGKKGDRPRPVLCQFLQYSHRDDVLRTARNLKKEGADSLRVSEDFSKKVREERRKLAKFIPKLKILYPLEPIYLTHNKLKVGKDQYTAAQIETLKTITKNTNETESQEEES